MRQRDLQQALLRGASINDTAFATLVQAGLGVSGLVAFFVLETWGRQVGVSGFQLLPSLAYRLVWLVGLWILHFGVVLLLIPKKTLIFDCW